VIAIDTSVLVDLFGDDSLHSAPAMRRLNEALAVGPVVVCEIVVTEIVAGLGSGVDVLEALEDSGIRFVPVEAKAAVRAGEMQRRYAQRRAPTGGPTHGRRAVPDFLIGAHALMQCDALITRDEGFYRDYFKGLKLIVPRA
jgi:predicted nucleic acid-binding protein